MFRQTEDEHLTSSFQQTWTAASRTLVLTVSWYKAGIALLTASQCTAAETASPNFTHIGVAGKEEIHFTRLAFQEQICGVFSIIHILIYVFTNLFLSSKSEIPTYLL